MKTNNYDDEIKNTAPHISITPETTQQEEEYKYVDPNPFFTEKILDCIIDSNPLQLSSHPPHIQYSNHRIVDSPNIALKAKHHDNRAGNPMLRKLSGVKLIDDNKSEKSPPKLQVGDRKYSFISLTRGASNSTLNDMSPTNSKAKPGECVTASIKPSPNSIFKKELGIVKGRNNEGHLRYGDKMPISKPNIEINSSRFYDMCSKCNQNPNLGKCCIII